MQRIFTAANRVDAYLLVDRLAHAGIKAHVFNENVSSIVGDVPPDVAQLQVWLDDDADKARAEAVLRAYQAERNRTGTLFCRHCREENPATFELCWKCGASL
jgi:glycerate-2-kinase